MSISNGLNFAPIFCERQVFLVGHSASDASENDGNPSFLERERDWIACGVAEEVEADCAQIASAAKCTSLNQVRKFRAGKQQFANACCQSNKLRRKNRNPQICTK